MPVYDLVRFRPSDLQTVPCQCLIIPYNPNLQARRKQHERRTDVSYVRQIFTGPGGPAPDYTTGYARAPN